MQPSFQILEQRPGFRLSETGPRVRWLAPCSGLDRIKARDPPDRRLGNGRALRLVYVDELAPDMRHAGDFGDLARTEQRLEAGIAIGMQEAAIALQMGGGVDALPVRREPVEGGRRCVARPRPLVPHIGPQPRRLRPARAGRQHADRRIIREHRPAFQNMARDRFGQRHQQRRRLAHPARQGRTLEFYPLAGIDAALPVKRQMIGILRDQHMGQQTRPGPAPFDWPRRQRRLMEPLAAGARQTRADDPVHDEPAGHILELFGDVLADPLEPAAAGGTAVASGKYLVQARQVRRQGPPLRGGFGGSLDQGVAGGRRPIGGAGNLFVFKRQVELVQRLGPRAKAMAPMPRQLMLQLLDQEIAEPKLGLMRRDLRFQCRDRLPRCQHQGLQFGDVPGQLLGGGLHIRSIAE